MSFSFKKKKKKKKKKQPKNKNLREQMGQPAFEENSGEREKEGAQ